jgi:ATP-dependent DNA helicase RecG
LRAAYRTDRLVVTLTLSSPISAIDRALATRRAGFRDKGPPAADVLAEALDIRTVRDLLHHYPRRYIDRSQVASIRELRVRQEGTVIARVKRTTKRQTRRRQSMVTVTLYDGSGSLDITFFNQPWAATLYKEGQELAVSGTAAMYRGKLQMANFEVEILRGAEADMVHTGRITPVHRATEGVTTRTIRELVFRALERLPRIPDPLPEDIVAAESLASFDPAIRAIHFPESQEDLARARERLKFDELFTLELGVAFRKHRMEAGQRGVAHETSGPLVERLLASLPFEPTRAQRRAMQQVGDAMGGPRGRGRAGLDICEPTGLRRMGGGGGGG